MGIEHHGGLRGLALCIACCAFACGGDKSRGDVSHPHSGVDAGTAATMVDAGDDHDIHLHVPQGPVTSVMQSDGGRPTSSGFGVEAAHGPRSTAKIRGLVLSTQLEPIRGADASAGGAAVTSSDQGFFLIDEVYGKDSADVLVRVAYGTQGRARVPIRAGEVSTVVIVIGSTASFPVDDFAAGGTIDPAKPRGPATDAGVDAGLDAGFDAGEAAPPPKPIVLTLPAGALVAPWGMAAEGSGTMTYALLNDPADAAAAPNGTFARDAAGAPVRLELRALFELHVEQGGTPFELTKPADVTVPIGPQGVQPLGNPSDGAKDGDRLYWFDPSAGAFVARDLVSVQDGIAHGTIDRFGFWAIGQPAAQSACVHGQVQNATDATPVPYAALRLTDTFNSNSALLWADASGTFCTQAAPGDPLSVIGLGLDAAGHIVRVDVPTTPGVYLSADAGSPSCDADAASCVDIGPLQAQPIATHCVRGTLKSVSGPASWVATDPTTEHSSSGTVLEDETFCIEVSAGAVLSFSAATMCGDAITVAAGAALCGADACQDVGTIECCGNEDICGDQIDQDCDGMTDEGCTCGTTSCALYGDRCCTSQGNCGVHTTLTGACLDDVPGIPNAMCPDEMLDGATLTGCCRQDMRCGILDTQFGCVAREDATDVVPITTSLMPIACTP